MSPAEYRQRWIEGRRKDLTRVRDLEADEQSLGLVGSGITSIRGIEQFHGLSSLTMLHLREPELERLGSLGQLEALSLGELRGDVDYTPVERLADLKSLEIGVTTPTQARTVAALDFGRLVNLESLHLSVSRPQCPISLKFLEELPYLTELLLIDLVVDDESLEAVGRHGLQQAHLTARDRGEAHRIRTALTGRVDEIHTYEQYLLLDSKPMLRVEKRKDAYELSADIATEWDLPDNLVAEQQLRRLLERERPELLPFVDWRSELGELIVAGETSRPLREIERFIARQPARHRIGRRAPSSRLPLPDEPRATPRRRDSGV